MNIALALTFVTSVSAGGAALAMVMGRGYIRGRDVMAGIDGKTTGLPFAFSLAVLVAGGFLTVLVVNQYAAGQRSILVVRFLCDLPVGLGSALMGSLVGNLAGSVMLHARDLGRWVRIDSILLILVMSLWVILMWVILYLLWRQIGPPVA